MELQQLMAYVRNQESDRLVLVTTKACNIAEELRHQEVTLDHVIIAILKCCEYLVSEDSKEDKANVEKEYYQKILEVIDSGKYYQRMQWHNIKQTNFAPGIHLMVWDFAEECCNQNDNYLKMLEKIFYIPGVQEYKLVFFEHLGEAKAIFTLLQQYKKSFEKINGYVLTSATNKANAKDTTSIYDFMQDTSLQTQMPNNQKPNSQKCEPLKIYCAEDLTYRAITEGVGKNIMPLDNSIIMLQRSLIKKQNSATYIIGEPGVGKTALVEALTYKIVCGKVPESLKECRILKVDFSSLMAGSQYKGNILERLCNVLIEIDSLSMHGNKNIILFISNICDIANDINQLSQFYNVLKPYLRKGMKIILTSTLSEYTNMVNYTAIGKVFETIKVKEASSSEALRILKALKPEYENYYGITITDATLKATVENSIHYCNNAFLPAKAIDLLDAVCAEYSICNQHVDGKKFLIPNHVLNVISEKTGKQINEISKGN